MKNKDRILKTIKIEEQKSFLESIFKNEEPIDIKTIFSSKRTINVKNSSIYQPLEKFEEDVKNMVNSNLNEIKMTDTKEFYKKNV